MRRLFTKAIRRMHACGRVGGRCEATRVWMPSSGRVASAGAAARGCDVSSRAPDHFSKYLSASSRKVVKNSCPGTQSYGDSHRSRRLSPPRHRAAIPVVPAAEVSQATLQTFCHLSTPELCDQMHSDPRKTSPGTLPSNCKCCTAMVQQPMHPQSPTPRGLTSTPHPLRCLSCTPQYSLHVVKHASLAP